MRRGPAGATFAVLALALVTAGVLTVVQPRDEASGATITARPEPPVRVLIVGDSYTAGTAMGGLGRHNWAQLAVADLRGEGYDLDVVVEAGGGSGYAGGGVRNLTFRQLAAAGAEDGGTFDLVVFVGSRNDTGGVLDAARAAFASVGLAAPGADLLVIGPMWVGDDVHPRAVRSRDDLEQATGEFGGTFVDPLAENWFTGYAERLVGEDGVHPTDAGHEYLASRIEPRLRAALERLT